MDALTLVRRRLRSQGLAGPGAASPEAAVGALLAVQAQDLPEARWSIGRRTRGATDAAVAAALDAGRLLRTHVLRPTWHVVGPEDVRWLLRLTAPHVHRLAAGIRRRHGLDAALLARGADLMAGAVERDGPRTRPQLGAALAAAGIAASGERLAHLVMHAELEQVLVSGPADGARPTYVLLDAVAPAAPPRSRDADLAQLARRYLAGHGPARPADLAKWSGLRLADARAAFALAGHAGDEPAGGAPRAARTGAVLLPTFDELTVGYAQERRVLGPPTANARFERQLLLDGEQVGFWSRTAQGAASVVEVTVARPLTGAEHALVATEVRLLGDFLGRPTRLALRA